MRVPAIVSALILIVGIAAAQQMVDVVYLKNGGVIHGLIIEHVPNESIKIKTVGANIFVFTMGEIEKIKKASPPSRSPLGAGSYGTRQQDHRQGYMGISTPAISFVEGKAVYGTTVINGGFISPSFSLGLGVGYEFWQYEYGRMMLPMMMLPMFADIRYYMLPEGVTPYWNANIGYSLGWIRDGLGANGLDASGLLLSSGIGVYVPTAGQFGLAFDISYERQASSAYTYVDQWGFFRVEAEPIEYNQITFRVGFRF